MNFSQIAETIGLSIDEFMEIAEGFVTATQSDLLQLRAGIHNNDHEQVCAAAHSIKGAALTFGFVAMHAAAQSVEVTAKENNLDLLPEAVDLVEQELRNIAVSLQHGSWA
jgi:HPt (histidine-containing phosphotransfer) domain-containing protein